jgi:N-acetylglutamate synthase-like GNAT family acetyltransferase
LRTHLKSSSRKAAVKNSPIALRRATARDVGPMIEIIKKTFSKEDAATAKHEIGTIFSGAACEQHFIVAIANKQIIGLAGLVQSWLDFNAYEILWVAVRPDFQKNGIGLMIIKELLAKAKMFKGHAAVRTVLLSTEAIAFFEKCGFTSIAKLNTGGELMIMHLGK